MMTLPEDEATERSSAGAPAGADLDSDSWRWGDRYGKPLLASLWKRAWGRQYPENVQPFSSCTVRLLGQLVEELELSPGSTLADFGCGAGGTGLWLARALDANLVGLDKSEGAIRICRSRARQWLPDARASFVAGDFSASGIPAQHVDAVVSVDALPFAKDVDAALAEVCRILRPGGRLLFTTRELSEHNPRWGRFGPAWSFALQRNGFRMRRAIARPEVSQLWRRLYDLWVEHEAELREELSGQSVDGMMEEARELGTRLREERTWLLVVAEKVAQQEATPG